MNFWLFTVTKQSTADGYFASDEILEQRLNDKFWGLGEGTPNRRYLKKGDRIVFYLGIPSAAFAACAVLASDAFSLSDEQKQLFGHSKDLYLSDYGVFLEDIHKWETPRFVKDLIPQLKFIRNKTNWGASFQGGIKELTEEDFQTIIENRQGANIDIGDPAIEVISQGQFALEAHLEDFIDKNWSRIDFGSQLAKYESEDRQGRQFPAGSWYIDFLCVDQRTNELVVLELKRGKTSDSTVGQIARYIAWVEENIAKPGQNVRGIIIAHEVDDALKYAVKGIGGGRVIISTYKVDFQLLPFRP